MSSISPLQATALILGVTAVIVLLMIVVVLPLAKKLDKRDEGKEGR